jgi:hypothetical protein
VKRTFLVHGDPEAADSFKEKLRQAGFGTIDIPSLGQEYKL